MDRFFKQLEHLFARVGVTSDKDKKEHVLEYVDFDVEQLWKIFPEYADQMKKISRQRLNLTIRIRTAIMSTVLATWRH